MGIPDSVFSKGLDGLAGRYLKHTRPINERAMKRVLTAEALRVAEAVLLSPKVTFKVYGENVVAPLLANFFGVTGVRRLLDDRAIDFILWDQVITSMNEPIPGMLPLAPGTLNTPPHAIPMESAKTGINGWGKGIPRKERKALARSVAKRTRTLPKGIAEATSHRVMELGANGGLRKIGIEGGDDWGVDARRHAKIRDFAASLMESAILTQTDLS